MLSLTRITNEAILIDGGIRIIVRHCRNGKVRLGIEAPPETKIVREEIVDPTAIGSRKEEIFQAVAARIETREFVSAVGNVRKFFMTQREDEIAVVGGVVRVRVTKISAGRVRLEFEEPRSVIVKRAEDEPVEPSSPISPTDSRPAVVVERAKPRQVVVDASVLEGYREITRAYMRNLKAK